MNRAPVNSHRGFAFQDGCATLSTLDWRDFGQGESNGTQFQLRFACVPFAKFESIVDDAIEFFVETPIHRLPPPSRFIGSGVYALYYVGDFELYTATVNPNDNIFAQPIYVGKAVPPGWRTARTKDTQSSALYQRLQEHTRSIRQATNLQIDAFRCRFVVLRGVESDLVVPVEAELIRRHKPLWNTVIDGFGNHDPGRGRYNQAKSEWDVLHPGRPWAERLTGEPPRLENIVDQVRRSTL